MATVDFKSTVTYCKVIPSEIEGRSESVNIIIGDNIPGYVFDKTSGEKVEQNVNTISPFYGEVVKALCTDKIIGAYLVSMDHAKKLEKIPMLLSGATIMFSREHDVDNVQYLTRINKIIVDDILKDMVREALMSAIKI